MAGIETIGEPLRARARDYSGGFLSFNVEEKDSLAVLSPNAPYWAYMVDFCSYLRVSTDKQGITGLGMDAQRESVKRYVSARGQLLTEFIEVESGRKENRPQLRAALEECRKHRAVLLIARLDRLGRNVAFIANLKNSDVEFVAVDMPQANRLTIHILAAVAEHEREMVSQRTKAALAAAKARGIKLGESSVSGSACSCARGSRLQASGSGSITAHYRVAYPRRCATQDC